MYVLQSRASRSRCSIPGTWYFEVRYMQAPNRLYKSEVRGSVSRVRTLCEQGLPHCTYVLQAGQRLPHATEEKAKCSFPMERGPTAKHHPAWNPQCTQWYRAEERKLLCPTPKVMPRFSLGDVEKRGGRCRTDGPIRVLSCQMRHTIAVIKAAWCRSLC